MVDWWMSECLIDCPTIDYSLHKRDRVALVTKFRIENVS